MSPEDFHVQPGQSIRPAIKRLASLVIRQAKLQAGAGMRRHQYLNGTAIVADRQPTAFVGRFFVRIAAKKATVGAGTVDGITPLIDGKPIDGGEDEKDVPSLTIDDGPNDQRRSWICVEARRMKKAPDSTEADPIDPEDEEALVITHRSDLTSKDFTDKFTGVRALAIVVWSDDTTISRVDQITYFDQATFIEEGKLRFRAAS